MSRERWLRVLRFAAPAALLALFAWRELAAMRADGTCADEQWHLAYGERALAEHTFRRPSDLWNSKMPVSMLNALAPRLAGGAELDWPRRLWLARLPTLGLGLLLGFLVWRWARTLFGEGAASLALVLYTCCPNFLAHGHLVTTDVATSLAMFGATFAFWRACATSAPGSASTTSASRTRWVVAAAALGAAQLTKVTALFLVPIFLLILLLRRWRGAAVATARGSRWRRVGAWLGFAVVALAVLNLGFFGEGTLQPLEARSYVSPAFQSLASLPVLRSVPVPLPAAYVEGLDMVARDAHAESWSYLRGEYSDHGFRSYFLWALALKLPVATLLLFGAALVVGLRRLRETGEAEVFLLTPIVFLLAYLSLFLRLDIGLRYALPVLPFAFVYAGRLASSGVSVSGMWIGRVTLGGLVLWLVVSSWLVHPHYLTYFNELAGGPRNGWRQLIDSNLDWGQDAGKARRQAAERGEIPPLVNPSGPVAGRIAFGLTALVGADPAAHARNAWLRDNFTPVETIGNSWHLYAVREEDLARCCAAMRRATVVDDLADDLALAGQPVGGADGVEVRLLDRLNDGTLGAGEELDAARTLPAQPAPVRAWFGVVWPEARTISRVVAYPGYGGRAERAAGDRRFLALDYVLQSWQGGDWHDIPGTRVTENASLRVEHRFAPVATTAVRILIERERNARGTLASRGFRAACLEIGVYAR